MPNTERYPFLAGDATLGEASFRPYLPFTLVHQREHLTFVTPKSGFYVKLF
ncbi:hypothetical protein [Microcystis aeruginosa]|uniref:hypothetical protein n=1 Tax=Microcystis aeruginosa TaxID=1126 RepID=UPI0002D8E586|nr:hypothetical protein [Microcystis aeruginosa]